VAVREAAKTVRPVAWIPEQGKTPIKSRVPV